MLSTSTSSGLLELTLYIQDGPKINHEPLEGEVEGDSRLHTHFPR